MRPHKMPKWQTFERLVTAGHKAIARGADVEWNTKLDGRQFDVVMRFRVGSYDYLTVIECKDQNRAVPVEQVEAFVTKARDVRADKAVVVSRSGFQAGAVRVAQRHNIDLFELSQLDGIPEDLLTEEFFPALQIYAMRFRHTHSHTWIELPEDKGLPAYLARHVIIRFPGRQQQLYQLLESLKPALLQRASSAEQPYLLTLPSTATTFFPHLHEEMPVSEFSFHYRLTSFRLLKTPGLDPDLLRGGYKYKNVLTGESQELQAGAVQFGLDTVLTPGKFYINPGLGFSYYRHKIEDGIATMSLIESYQHGRLLQACFTQAIEHAGYYVEITDEQEIERLKKVGAKCLASETG